MKGSSTVVRGKYKVGLSVKAKNAWPMIYEAWTV